ncbi:hypothetical protein BDV3_003006 [Batrachochytrium dendrobatidis]
MVKNPEFNASSPQGWTDGQETTGNNVLAADQTSGTPSSGINGAFDSSFNPQEDPRTAANVKASAINLFYIGNIVHDISYQYGFTEAAGNFQKDNFGKGGEGNDVVVINVQSTAGTDDAKFYAPADGQPGEMDMFRFTTTTPNRDGGLDNVIPIHDLSTATKTSASSTEIATSSIGKSASATETATSSIGKSISATEIATSSIGKSISATETAASATETTLVATGKSTSTTAVATSSPLATQSSPDPKPRTTTHDKPHHTHSTKLSSTRQPSVPTPHPKCHA